MAVFCRDRDSLLAWMVISSPYSMGSTGQLFPSLDSHGSPFSVLLWEERMPRTQPPYVMRECSGLQIPDCGLTLTSCVTLGKSQIPANLEFLHLKPVVRNHSWNDKPMSTWEMQMCYINVNRYARSSFYELLKENLAECTLCTLRQNKEPGQVTVLWKAALILQLSLQFSKISGSFCRVLKSGHSLEYVFTATPRAAGSGFPVNSNDCFHLHGIWGN